MLSGGDILEREILRLQHLIENRKLFGRLSHSKAALLVIAVMVLIFRKLPCQRVASTPAGTAARQVTTP